LNLYSPFALIAEGFIIYLSDYTKSDGYPLKSSTIAEYLSHAVSAMIGRNLIFNSDEFYSRLFGIINGLAKRDLIFYPPLRLKQKLSITLIILKLIILKASKHPNPHIAQFLMATSTFGWSTGSRPGDYLDLNTEQNGHNFTSEVVNFIFKKSDAPINICSPQLYPQDTDPLYFSLLPDLAKNDQFGDAVMRTVPCNPDKTPEALCLVKSMFTFFSNSQYCPNPGQRIFSKFSNFSDANLKTLLENILKEVAIETGLPHELMHLHEFRAGIIEQLADETDEDQDAAGGWKHSTNAIGGRKPYVRVTIASTIRMADRIARSLYNLTSTSTIEQLIWMHTTPTSTALNIKRKRLEEINSEQLNTHQGTNRRPYGKQLGTPFLP